MNLTDKTALVTGGAVRIGRSIVSALADAGCRVLIHYGRSAGPAAELKEQITAQGGRAEIFSANLADPQSVAEVFPAAARLLGPVDLLVNNASIYPEDDSFAASDGDSWDHIMMVNAKAPYLLCRAFAAQLPDDRTGKIVNINDANIPHPAVDHIIYRLSKRALWDMSLILAKELAPRITVNQVAVGSNLPVESWDKDDYEERVAARVPLGRPGTPEEIAQNVVHLFQQDYLNGVTIPVDGGENI
ncbi:MAG: SDR family oxidoreductase [Ardenticatenaceae bacterium]|nr:SDR family oxidoreductase [Ardenticatenaceae bacterium]